MSDTLPYPTEEDYLFITNTLYALQQINKDKADLILKAIYKLIQLEQQELTKQNPPSNTQERLIIQVGKHYVNRYEDVVYITHKDEGLEYHYVYRDSKFGRYNKFGHVGNVHDRQELYREATSDEIRIFLCQGGLETE